MILTYYLFMVMVAERACSMCQFLAKSIWLYNAKWKWISNPNGYWLEYKTTQIANCDVLAWLFWPLPLCESISVFQLHTFIRCYIIFIAAVVMVIHSKYIPTIVELEMKFYMFYIDWNVLVTNRRCWYWGMWQVPIDLELIVLMSPNLIN